MSTASVTVNTTAAERLACLIPQPLVDRLSRPGVWQPGTGRSWGTVPQVFGPSQVSRVAASASAEPVPRPDAQPGMPSRAGSRPSWPSRTGLGDLAVGHSAGGHGPHALRSPSGHPAPSPPAAVDGHQRPELVFRPRSQALGAAAVGEVEPRVQVVARGHPVVAPAQRRPQFHQGSCALKDRLCCLQDVQRRFEQVDAALASSKATGCPKRDALASTQPTPSRTPARPQPAPWPRRAVHEAAPAPAASARAATAG